MSLSPWFKSPFTDMTGAVISHQWGGRCSELEMKALDCLEAYGLDKGRRVCGDLIADFQECALRTKEIKRLYAITDERQRQYRAGELSKEEHYAKPPQRDSF